jgi:Flp pilus assembly protein TadB
MARSLNEPLPEDARNALTRVSRIMLVVGWAMGIGLCVLALATGGNPAGVAFIAFILLFFTLVVWLFERNRRMGSRPPGE